MSLRERLAEALLLKEVPRAGWARVGVPRPESVAHSWGVAWSWRSARRGRVRRFGAEVDRRRRAGRARGRARNVTAGGVRRSSNVSSVSYLFLGAVASLSIACGEPVASSTAGGGASTQGGGGVGGGGGAGGLSEGGGGTGGDAVGGAGGSTPPCDDAGPLGVADSPPDVLSETGLYDDIVSKTLSPLVASYVPRFPLWSDGAAKERHVLLPPCPVDTSDMDRWRVPVGIRLWKAFTVGGVLVETRLIHRFGPGDGDFWYAAYQWNADHTEATRVPDGVVDANGTEHDIPSADQCFSCHAAAPERVLSFSALQLSHSGPGVTLSILDDDGMLTHSPPPGIEVPGDPVAQAALGYLHANCGNCHNPSLAPMTLFSTKLRVSDQIVEDTDTFVDAVGVPALAAMGGATLRIAPGDPSDSVVSYRMGQRAPFVQMPPLGTDVVDGAGLAAVDAWITSLP